MIFKAYLAKFRHPERSGEEKHYKAWFQSLGYEVFESQEFFEGGGDAVICRPNNKLWAGYGARSVKEVRQLVLFCGHSCIFFRHGTEPCTSVVG